MTELEITLKNIAVKLGKELAVQTGGNAVFGRKIQVDKTSCKYFSSAESLNTYLANINEIFNRAGDKE
jgi:hypothetical protein